MHRTPQLRFLGRALGVAFLLPLAFSSVTSSVAWAAPIDDARARAARLERELDEQGRQVSIMTERFNQSRLKVAGVEAAVAKAADEIGRSSQRLANVRRLLVGAAVTAYVSGGSASSIGQIIRGGNDLVVRGQYLRVTAADQRQVLGQVRAAREDLVGLQRRLAVDREAARVVAAATGDARRQVLDAEATQRRLLNGVRGDLARLVTEEAARREAEVARRAEAARRVAAEAAARAAATAGPQTAAPGPRASPLGSAGPGLAGSPPPSGSTAPASGRVAAVIEVARAQLGKPYVWGGSGPSSFDCSGLTGYAWRAGGVRLSHSAYIQYTETTRVSPSQVQPGDLLFFGPNVRGIHHNALYIGNGQMIEASQSGTPVRIRGWRSVDLVGVGRPG